MATFLMFFMNDGESRGVVIKDGKFHFPIVGVPDGERIGDMCLKFVSSMGVDPQDCELQHGLTEFNHETGDYYHTYSLRVPKANMQKVMKTTLSTNPEFYSEFDMRCWHDHTGVLKSRILAKLKTLGGKQQ